MNEEPTQQQFASELAISMPGEEYIENTAKFIDKAHSFISNDVVSMESHNESYTNILKCYSEGIDKTLSFKHTWKQRFLTFCGCVMFILTSLLTGILFAVTYMVFSYPDIKFDIESIIAIVATIGTAFVSSFIVITQIITKYIFNIKEDESMINIVKNIQKHDLAIRSDIKNYNKDDA